MGVFWASQNPTRQMLWSPGEHPFDLKKKIILACDMCPIFFPNQEGWPHLWDSRLTSSSVRRWTEHDIGNMVSLIAMMRPIY